MQTAIPEHVAQQESGRKRCPEDGPAGQPPHGQQEPKVAPQWICRALAKRRKLLTLFLLSI